MLLVEHDWLTPEDFSALPRGARATSFKLPPEGLNLEEVERDLLLQALDRTEWNQTHAGRLLGINRDQVRYRIEKFGLPPAAQQRSAAALKVGGRLWARYVQRSSSHSCATGTSEGKERQP